MKRLSRLTYIAALMILYSCGSGGSSGNNQTYSQQNNVSVYAPISQTPANVVIQPANVAGFDVNALANLVKTTTNASTLEQAINAPGNAINNLDLNNDSVTDYLQIKESLNQMQIVDVAISASPVIATLNITPNAGNTGAALAIQGSPTYCGSSYSYNSNFTLADALMLHYLLYPHHYYYSSYHYGYYPIYYTSRRSYYRSAYVTHYRTVYHTNVINRPVYRTTPPAGRSSFSSGSVNTRSSISNPVRSQRSFTSTPTSSTPRTTSFGSGSRSSSFGSSRSSFGGSRSSSFGGGRHR